MAPKSAPVEDPALALRREADRRLILMRDEQSSWRETWREITHYIMPTRGRYVNAPNQGSRGLAKGRQIVDRTATIAVGNLAAFLMAGITSPARDWFRLTTSNDRLNHQTEVKQWLAEVQSRLQRVFASGNFYQAIAQIYEEIGGFGTGAIIILQDYEDVVRFYPLTAGEYYLAQNDRLEVDTLFREYVQTVAQLVGKFGYENCSSTVQQLYDNRALTREIPVIHAIFPNMERLHGALGWRSAPYIGVYYEYGSQARPCLRIEGFADKPFIAPRWHAVSNDCYGHGPAEDALPDVKSLQVAQLRLAEAIDKFVRPPMMADSALQNGMLSLVPGGLNFIPGLAAQSQPGMRPIYQTTPNLGPLQERIEEFRNQIQKTLKNDLILMVSQIEGEQPRTATEINAREQEKLLALGPVLERFHNEALDPIINTTMGIMERGGLLPPRPLSLRRAMVRISYVSVLAQAQRATETTAIEQLYRFVGGLIGIDPTLIDNLQTDFAVREYGDLLGVDERMFTAPDQVDAMREARQSEQKQINAAKFAMAAVQGARTLSQTDIGGGENALQAIMSGIS